MRSKWISIIVLIASIVNWSVPSFALRQKEFAEAGLEEQEKLVLALTGDPNADIRQVSQAAYEVARKAFAPVPSVPALSGLEEGRVTFGEEDLGHLQGKGWWDAMPRARREAIARFFGETGRRISIPADHNNLQGHYKSEGKGFTVEQAQLAIFNSMAGYVDSFLFHPESMLGRSDKQTKKFVSLKEIRQRYQGEPGVTQSFDEFVSQGYGRLRLHPGLPKDKIYVVKWEGNKTPNGDVGKKDDKGYYERPSAAIGNQPTSQGEELGITLKEIAAIPQVVGVKFMIYVDSYQPDSFLAIMPEVKKQALAAHKAGLLFFPEDLPAKTINGSPLPKDTGEKARWEADSALRFAEALFTYRVDFDAHKFTFPGTVGVMTPDMIAQNLQHVAKYMSRPAMMLSGGRAETVEQAKLAIQHGLPIVGFFPGRAVWGPSFWHFVTLRKMRRDLREGGTKKRFDELAQVLASMRPFWEVVGYSSAEQAIEAVPLVGLEEVDLNGITWAEVNEILRRMQGSDTALLGLTPLASVEKVKIVEPYPVAYDTVSWGLHVPKEGWEAKDDGVAREVAQVVLNHRPESFDNLWKTYIRAPFAEFVNGRRPPIAEVEKLSLGRITWDMVERTLKVIDAHAVDNAVNLSIRLKENSTDEASIDGPSSDPHVTVWRIVVGKELPENLRAQSVVRAVLNHEGGRFIGYTWKAIRDPFEALANGRSSKTGLEEAATLVRPFIGVLPATSSAWLGNEDYRRFSIEFSQILGRINSEKVRRAAGIPSSKPLYAEFDRQFGELLLQVGDARAFAHNFEDWVQFGPLVRQQVLDAIRHLAQDPGAPYNEPPVSYYNPARFLYAKLQEEAMNQFATGVLTPAVDTIRRVIVGRNLADVHQKAEIVKILRERLGDGRQARGPFQYEFFYDSLAEKNGEHYLVVQLLLDGAEDYRQGVVLELLVTIPKQSLEFQYHTPYDLGTFAVPQGPSELFGMAQYNVGLLDPIHLINNRFPEWRPTPQRKVYEARLKALKDKKIKRQYIRSSVRHGNNFRYFEAFFQAYLYDDVPLDDHIVHTDSERDYGNATGVTYIMNKATAIVARGGTSVTASWWLDADEQERAILEQMLQENDGRGRQLIYTHEMDHHRAPWGRFEYLLGAYQEAVSTGWASANLQDETDKINVKVRDAWVALIELAEAGVGVPEATRDEILGKITPLLEPIVGPKSREDWMALPGKVAQTDQVDADTFKIFEAFYNGGPTDGQPSAFSFNWVRNRMLKWLVTTYGVPAGGVPYGEIYIEPDVALDGKPHFGPEMAYISLMFAITAQAHGYKLSPVVPSYGNVHGASAGNPNLALSGVQQYAAQVAIMHLGKLADTPEGQRILAIIQKAPRGYLSLVEQAAERFKDPVLREALLREVGVLERTQEEEEELKNFVLAQLQLIPKDVMQLLTAAERAIATQAVREGPLNALTAIRHGVREEGKSLPSEFPTLELLEVRIGELEREVDELRMEVDRRIQAIRDRMDPEIDTLDIDERAAITTHAASGLSAEQLRRARDYGVWLANKSTEWQNVNTKMLHIVYLMAVDPAETQKELAQLPPSAQAAWKAHPLSQAEVQRLAKMYANMWDTAVARAYKAAKDADKPKLLEMARKHARLRSFPWYFDPEAGWSMPDTPEWRAFEKALGILGPHGRYMVPGMRDAMIDWNALKAMSTWEEFKEMPESLRPGQFWFDRPAERRGDSQDGVLLFPNALTFGLPPTVIRMAWAATFDGIRFYHKLDVMNAIGGAAEVREYLALAASGLEEIRLEPGDLRDRQKRLDVARHRIRQYLQSAQISASRKLQFVPPNVGSSLYQSWMADAAHLWEPGLDGESPERPWAVYSYVSDGVARGDLEILASENEFIQAVERLKAEAGLEEIPVLLETRRNLVILTPHTAVDGVFQGLAILDPTPPLAVIVANDRQETEVLTGLEEADLTLALPMVNLQRRGIPLMVAEDELKLAAWARRLETFVLKTFDQVRELGKYLKIPEISLRSWAEWIERSAVKVAA